MNRRSFLRTSSAVGVGSLAFANIRTPKLLAQSPGLDPNVMATAAASHVTATANVYGGVAQGADWKNMSNGAAAVYQNMQNIGFDAQLAPIANQISASQLDINTLNKSQIVSSVQVYQPAFQEADFDQLLSLIPTDSASLSAALTKIQQNGFSPYASQAVAQFNRICTIVNDSQNQGSPSVRRAQFSWPGKERRAPKLQDAIYRPSGGSVGVKEAAWERMQQPPPGQAGGGYNCEDDAVALLAVGTVFAVLAIMAGPAGVLAGGALLDSAIFWGSTGSAAWALGHTVFCGF